MLNGELRPGTLELFREEPDDPRAPVAVWEVENDAQEAAAALAILQSGLGLRPALDEELTDHIPRVQVHFHLPGKTAHIPTVERVEQLRATLTFLEAGREEVEIHPDIFMDGRTSDDMVVLYTPGLKLGWDQISDILHDVYRESVDDDSYGEDAFTWKSDLYRHDLAMQGIAHAIADKSQAGIGWKIQACADNFTPDPHPWPTEEMSASAMDPVSGAVVTVTVTPGEMPGTA